MYINDIHILFYLSIGVIGLIVGQLIDWLNMKKYYQKIFLHNIYQVQLPNTCL